jgi:HSP20 family protein
MEVAQLIPVSRLGAPAGGILTQVKNGLRAGPSMEPPSLETEASMANITRYNPFDEMFNEFSKGFWVKPLAMPAGTELSIKVDVKEDDKSYTVRADIPGVKKEDIQVDIDGGQVSLRAESKQEKEEKKGEKVIYSERSYGMVSRSFSLPTEVDAKGAKAEYKDGVLNLTLPKKSDGSGKRIAVS